MNKQRWMAVTGLVLGAVATAVLASPYGGNQAVHTACDIALKVLVALGFTAPVSLLGGSGGAPPESKSALPGEISKFGVLLPLLFAGALMASGCTTPGGKALKACELGKLAAETQIALATGQAIASDPSSTVSDLEMAALKFLPGQFECAAAALMAWWAGRSAPPMQDAVMAASSDAQSWHARDVLRRYLALHRPSACASSARL